MFRPILYRLIGLILRLSTSEKILIVRVCVFSVRELNFDFFSAFCFFRLMRFLPKSYRLSGLILFHLTSKQGF